jgi:hypothetical protein
MLESTLFRAAALQRKHQPKGCAMSHIKRQIVTILSDQTLPDDEKIEVLRQLEADSLSKERSATEGMTAVDGDDGEDLKAIEQALRKLGSEPVGAGASSL